MTSAPTTDIVLVCGAGAAGMAAAVAASRAGAKVWLVEATAELGGTVASVLIHTLGGLFDSAGELLNRGLPAELAGRLQAADHHTRKRQLGRAWVLNACPDVYRAVVKDWLSREPNIRCFFQTRVIRLVRECDRIVGAELGGPRWQGSVGVRALIDCTGSAAVLRDLGPDLVEHDPYRAAGGLMLRLRGIDAVALAFPRNLAGVRALRSAAAAGQLPADCAKAWLDQGVLEDEAYVKLLVAVPSGSLNDRRCQEVRRKMENTAAAVLAVLRQVPGFERAVIDRLGALGVRDGGRARGQYCLTEADVRQGRTFQDGVCRCAWPIEFWDADKGVCLDYLPPGVSYEIPLRALKIQGFLNVFAAGKCLSAERRAQASARVAGTCWAMGEAVGKAAAS